MLRGIFGTQQQSNQLIESILTNMIQEGLDAEENTGVSQTTLENIRNNATVVDDTSEISQCSICLESINVGENRAILSCEHVFHLSCIERWCSTHNSCPICRRPIEREQPPQEQERSQRTQRIIVSNITTVQIAFHINESIFHTYWYSSNTIVDIFNYLSQMQNTYVRIMLQINTKIFKTTESYEYLSQTFSHHGIVGNVDAYVQIL